MADAWGVSWGSPSKWGVSWAAGVVVTPPATPAPEVGHAGGRRRRRVIIDDVIYVGTDEQIEAKLWELVQQRKKPVVAKPQKKKAKQKVVELKTVQIPRIALNLQRFEQLKHDFHADAFLSGMLTVMLKRYLDDEDDVEVLLLH